MILLLINYSSKYSKVRVHSTTFEYCMYVRDDALVVSTLRKDPDRPRDGGEYTITRNYECNTCTVVQDQERRGASKSGVRG